MCGGVLEASFPGSPEPVVFRLPVSFLAVLKQHPIRINIMVYVYYLFLIEKRRTYIYGYYCCYKLSNI